jgi:polysaccharide biosynthesis/export protein
MILLRPMAFIAAFLACGVAAEAQHRRSPAPWPESYIRRGPPDLRLGPGDVLIVTIYEAAPGGLFTNRPGGTAAGNFVQLPPQQIGRSGTVKIPYTGAVQAAGLRIDELEAEIEARLKPRAIEPQVVITLQERLSGRATVLGAVNRPGEFTLDAGGGSLVGLLARAGGASAPSFETRVILHRAGRQPQEP